MTTAKWYDVFDEMLDETLRGYYRTYEKDTWLNAAILEWLNAVVPLVERDEQAINFLLRLNREYSDTSGSDVIGLTFPYKALELVEGLYGQDWQEIVLQQLNYVRKHDSFHSPSDLFPRYRAISDAAGPKLRILSTTVPSEVRITYITIPPVVSDMKQEEEWDDYFLDDVQYMIIGRAIGKTAIPAQDAFRLQAAPVGA